MPEQKETWIQLAVLTAAVLAVLAAVAALRTSSYSTKVQLAATQEANQWADYRFQSSQEHRSTLNRDLLSAVRLLEPKNPKAQKFLNSKIKEYDDEIARSTREKDRLQKSAADLTREQESYQLKNGHFALAVILLQIAILCAALGALIKKKLMWLLGLLLGGWGLAYCLTGFLR